MRFARLTALTALVLALLATPLAAHAQPTGNVHRIGFLSSGFPAPATRLISSVKVAQSIVVRADRIIE